VNQRLENDNIRLLKLNDDTHEVMDNQEALKQEMNKIATSTLDETYKQNDKLKEEIAGLKSKVKVQQQEHGKN